ncbi:MAG: PmoA family protein [Bacteroidota bacterium]
MRPLLCLFLAICCTACGPSNVKLQLTISEGFIGPVQLDLPADYEAGSVYALGVSGSEEVIPAQADQTGQLWFFPVKKADGSYVSQYELSPKQFSPPQQHRLTIESGQLHIHHQEQEILTYHIKEAEPPLGEPDYYRRSGFIHPIFTPDSSRLSEGFPEGHVHQHGLFMAWTKTDYKGLFHDFWNQQKELGRIYHDAMLDTLSGPVLAQFRSRLLHQSMLPEAGSDIVLSEEWTVTTFHHDDVFFIDLWSEQLCVSDSPLHLLKHIYGGLGFRANSQWMDHHLPADSLPNLQGAGQGGFLTSEGKTRLDGNHSQPEWVCMYGQIDGRPAGILAMGHPDNFRAPQSARLHPSMPYFSLSPIVEESFSMEPEGTYHSRFRFICFDGVPDHEKLQNYWQSYANPPKISLH